MPDSAAKILHGDASLYRSSQARYNDYMSSAIILAILGVLGLVFSILNIFKVLSLFTTTFQHICSVSMFVAFIILSVYCYRVAMFNKTKISKEEDLQDHVIKYLKDAVTNDILKSFDEPDKDSHEGFNRNYFKNEFDDEKKNDNNKKVDLYKIEREKKN